MTLRMAPSFAALAALLAPPVASQPPVEQVMPSVADRNVANYDYPDLVLGGGAQTRGAPLVVFLPGTGGGPNGGPRQLLQTIAAQGYRVIYLPYDDVPAVSQVCPSRPPQCSSLFRQARVFGGSGGPVTNPLSEAITSRLLAAVLYLDRQHPGEGWADYVAPDGGLAWPRIIVSGLSQGAGMAAFIAKRFAVDRVVLFSSPWDEFGPRHQPAPWLFEPSATPPDRWWAERHARENTTQWIANAYEALRIPRDHIFIFNGGLPHGASGNNPYHVSTVQTPEYREQWRIMYGAASH